MRTRQQKEHNLAPYPSYPLSPRGRDKREGARQKETARHNRIAANEGLRPREPTKGRALWKPDFRDFSEREIEMPLERIRNEKAIVSDINRILSENGIEVTIERYDVTITEKTVSDLVKIEANLSMAIINHLWSSIEEKTVYHYTTRDAAESILTSNTFRLANIAKRYDEGEIKTFCETHKLDGYLELDGNGDPKYKELIMPNTYYASFTDTSLTKKQEQYFWKNFASPDGVRLKIEVTASSPDFRKMQYEQQSGQPISVLADLGECMRKEYSREFVLKGISRLCSFYLSGEDYGIENEFRALYRVWGSYGPQAVGSGAESYIELPLGKMSECGYHLDITEVHAVEKPDMPDKYNKIFLRRNL